MKVLYQEGLASLAGALGKMGFEMHPMNEEIEADAVLYTSSVKRALQSKPGIHGALLLNARGLNAAQAADALRRRMRTPLF